MTEKHEIAVFGGGCFWCTEAVFRMLKGVISVEPGYAGGPSTGGGRVPTYEEVSSGETGHAEVIRIEYDPSLVSYHDLMTVFFASHDPTTMNKQWADVGTQYRSIILSTSDEQQKEAESFIAELNNESKDGLPTQSGVPIVTLVVPFEKFYSAENYHHDYYASNPNKGYCAMVIDPKLEKVRKEFAALLSDKSKQK